MHKNPFRKSQETQTSAHKHTWCHLSRGKCCSGSLPFAVDHCLEGAANTSAATQNTLLASLAARSKFLKFVLIFLICVRGMIIQRETYIKDEHSWNIICGKDECSLVLPFYISAPHENTKLPILVIKNQGSSYENRKYQTFSIILVNWGILMASWWWPQKCVLISRIFNCVLAEATII